VPRKPKIIKPSKPADISNEDRSPVDMNITDNVKTFTNTDITITCTATGLPSPIISWLYNGKPVSNVPRYLVFKNGTLVIRKLTKNDEGKYTCLAKNFEGEDTASSNVEVTGKLLNNDDNLV